MLNAVIIGIAVIVLLTIGYGILQLALYEYRKQKLCLRYCVLKEEGKNPLLLLTFWRPLLYENAEEILHQPGLEEAGFIGGAERIIPLYRINPERAIELNARKKISRAA